MTDAPACQRAGGGLTGGRMVTKSLTGVLIALLLSLPLHSLQAQQRTTQETPEQEQARRIELLERRLTAMSDVLVQMDALQREVKQLRGEIEVQNHALDALKKRQRDLYLDVDQRLNQLSHGSAPMPDLSRQPPPEESVVPEQSETPMAAEAEVEPPSEAGAEATLESGIPPATGPTSGDPEPLAAPVDSVAEESEYKQAFGLLMQRRYPEARKAFQQFLGRYGAGNYADNAQYWLAEASYVTRDFDTALVEFQKVISDYPNSSKVPDAMLKSSFIFYEKQQWTESRELLQRLVTLYPTSTAARLATQRLDRLDAEGH